MTLLDRNGDVLLMSPDLGVLLMTGLSVDDALRTEGMTFTADLFLLINASLHIKVRIRMQLHHLTRVARHGL